MVEMMRRSRWLALRWIGFLLLPGALIWFVIALNVATSEHSVGDLVGAWCATALSFFGGIALILFRNWANRRFNPNDASSREIRLKKAATACLPKAEYLQLIQQPKSG